MKPLFYCTLALLLFSFTNLFGQAVVKISGLVIDSNSKKTLPYTTINLLLKDKAVKSTYTTADGKFLLTNIKPDTYTLEIIALGYSRKRIGLQQLSGDIDLPVITLSEQPETLSEVKITAPASLVNQKADRLIYNFTADPDSKTADALTIFRKIPYLSVMSNQTLLMSGSSDFVVLVNGRKSSVYNANPAEVLRAVPADNIDHVEVITSPGAKYDAEGTAGVINIVLKKIPLGYQGRATARYNTPNAGPAANNTLNIRGLKWGFSEFLSFNHNNMLPISSESWMQGINTSVMQESSVSAGNNMVLASGELTYEPDKRNLFSAALSFNDYRIRHQGDRSSLIENGSTAQSYHLNSQRKLPRSAMDVNANYQHNFKKTILTASYQLAETKSEQHDFNLYDMEQNFAGYSFKQYNRFKGYENTGQIDFVTPYKDETLEFGLKVISRNISSDFTSFYDLANDGVYVEDPNRADYFSYTQVVYSAYSDYEFLIGTTELKLGARLENTDINADFAHANSTVKQNYYAFIPAVSFLYPVGKAKLTFNYTKRLERPGIKLLNPFLNQNMPLNHFVGNPDLKAVNYHSLRSTYSRFQKVGLLFSIEYNFTKNSIQSVYSSNGSVTLQSYANIARKNKLMGGGNLTATLAGKINLNINANIASVNVSGAYNGKDYENNGVEWNFSSDFSYPFGKNFRAGLNLNYISPRIVLQSESNSYLESTISISKSLLKRKLLLSGYLANPFKKMITNYSDTYGADYFQHGASEAYFRQFNITATYSFGKLKKQIPKINKKISNTDVVNNAS